jgi:HTH-type transcriptional repressor of NAD biosynthesis genes
MIGTTATSDKLAAHGLVIGKFLPPHAGHLGLIRFAAARCDRLTVLVGARPDEPVPGPLRKQWLAQALAAEPTITVDYTEDDLPDAPRSERAVSKVWASYLKQRYQCVGAIFSSEAYGNYLAEYMGIVHAAYDPGRAVTPVSGRAIMADPFQHWEYILPQARPHFVQKVCVYGPESTGKTVLTGYLAKRFGTAFVPEMAREYFRDRMPAHEGEMLDVAELHAREILARAPQADKVLFVDTDHLTTKIYWQEFFGRAPKFEAWIEQANAYGLYLLLDIDVPWVADPLRECGDKRAEHMEWFKRELDQAGISYALVGGDWEQREQRAVAAVLERWPSLKGSLR